jgi:class 3 adenylate cyclase
MDRTEVRYARTKDGVHIAWQAFGTGRFDILFVPGQITHLDLAWENPQEVAWFRRLATLGRVIMLDQRGVGLSDRLSPRDLPPVEVLVEDLSAVLDAAGATKAVLFGTATGAQLACLFAALHPERVRGLATYALWSHVSGDFRRDYEEFLDLAPSRWGSLESALYDARDVQPSRAGDRDYLAWVARLQRNALSPGSIRPFGVLQMALDIRDVLPAVAVPTLALYRPNETSVPPELLRSSAALIPDATVVELPGTDHWWSAEPVAPLIDELEAFLARLGGGQAPSPRRLSTVLFTDIVGSTARAAELGDGAWRETLVAHHALVRGELERHGGTEVDTAGDGFFASFDGPARAVRCARAIISRVGELGLQVRAGVHTGEIETFDGKVGGIAVVIGARIGNLAGPSEVLVSSTVKDLTAGSGLMFEDAGVRELKGVPDPWRLYRVTASGPGG